MPIEPQPTATATPKLERGTSVGRYLLLELLGEGGMGVVYKAYDPELGRPVALKLLQTAEDASLQRDRLLREAQALARLQHPNVIAVHDVGTFGADVFIAMEFVEGQNARQWLKAQPRSRREILDVFLAAAQGLAAAHRAGLVHRDFKPDNMMVGDDGRVRVLDFGLARTADPTLTSGVNANANANVNTSVNVNLNANLNENVTVTGRSSRRARSSSESGHITPQLLATPLTHAGAIVGTPRFMAPEQHLGEPTGEPADQFSFCVSLYWALYDAFPFAGVEETIAGQIAPPPAGATVPRWLRQAIERGLSWQPEARHPSMSALIWALEADPAVARRRWLRGALLVIAIAALVAAAIAGGLAYQARRSAAEQARLSQVFGQEVEKVAAIARYSAYMPLHDTRRELDTIRARMVRLKERMHALGPIAAGPGHHALGRGYLVLERWDEALVELEAAWATGYRSPELAYALGLVHGQLYQRALADLRKTRDAALDARRREEITRAHRDPALRYLKLAGAQEGLESPEYVEGLIALYEQRFDDALVLARKAGDRVSWLFEAQTLEGDIHLVSGKDRFLKGEVDEALASYRRAGEAYRAVSEVAHSSFAPRMGECRELLEVMALEVYRDLSPEETVKQALAACGAAATARPDDAAPVSAQANAWKFFGAYQVRHGADPTPAETTAIRLGEQALAIDPRDLKAHEVVGLAEWQLAEFDTTRGADPTASLDGAIRHAQRATEIDPTFFEALSLAVNVYETRGEYQARHGADPRVSFRMAIESGERALKIAPTSFGVWLGLSMAHWDVGRWQRDHGEDFAPAFRRAEEALQKVVELAPTLDYGYVNLCSLQVEWADFERRRGDDPRRRLEQAVEQCRQAIRMDDHYSGSYLNVGRSYVELANLEVDHGADPTPLLARARPALDRGLEIDPQDVEAPMSQAKGFLVEARWLIASGRDPRGAFTGAEARAKRAVSVSGGKEPDALRTLAETYRARAQWRARRAGDPGDEVREGLALTARALAENPTHADSAETEGALQLILARAAASPGARAEAARRARRALEHALELNLNLKHEVRPLLDEAQRLSLEAASP
jgi:tetratricopeptide (TPR) repeat protein/tRNA A-37 threonylcarbamoyl transferase component Bud32